MFRRSTLHILKRWIIGCLACLSLTLGPALGSELPSDSKSNAGPIFAPTPDHGRILIVQNRLATEAFVPRPSIIEDMLRAGLLRFTGKDTIPAAWLSLVSTQDVIGIKVHAGAGPNSGTRLATVSAVVQSLLDSGFSPQHIIVWDRRLVDLRLAGFTDLESRYHITVTGALNEGFDGDVFYTSSILGRLVFGDRDFREKGEGIGRKSYVSKLLTQRITKIINVTPLLNHNYAGVSGILYGLATSSVDNVLRFDEPERLATAVPEIYAIPEIGDRVALNIVDALICQYRGEEQTLLHYSTVLNQLWFSNDAVATDVLALQELEKERGDDGAKKTGAQIYINAGIMDLGVADPRRIQVEYLRMH